ncbi:MAG: transposase, partial [Alphaproteobacteria bacterium]
SHSVLGGISNDFKKCISNDFKKDSVSQVVDRGYSGRDVADRLGISTKSLYTWKAQFSKPNKVRFLLKRSVGDLRLG